MNHLMRDFTYGTVAGLLLGPIWGIVQWTVIAIFIMPHMIPRLIYTAQNHDIADIFYTGAMGILTTKYALYGVGVGVVFGAIRSTSIVVGASRYFGRFGEFFRNTLIQSVFLCFGVWIFLLIDFWGFVVVPNVLVEVLPETVVAIFDICLFLMWGAVFGFVFEKLRNQGSHSDENKTMLMILFGVGLILLGMNVEYLFSAVLIIAGILIILAAHYGAL